MSSLERPPAKAPAWVVVALGIGGLVVAFWLAGVVLSAIGLIVRLVLAAAIIVLAAAWVVSRLERNSS